MEKTIGILGGTGKQGTALAKRLIEQNYSVFIGSRDEKRGDAKAKELNREYNTDLVKGGTNSFACRADVVFISVPFSNVKTILSPIVHNLTDKIVIDMNNNLEFGQTIVAKTIDGKSSYEYILKLLPNSHVVASFKTVSHIVLDKAEQIGQTDFQLTSSDEAFEITSKIAKDLGLTPVRIRGVYHAHTLERMVALSIQINKEYTGSHSGFKVTNIKRKN